MHNGQRTKLQVIYKNPNEKIESNSTRQSKFYHTSIFILKAVWSKSSFDWYKRQVSSYFVKKQKTSLYLV